MKLPEMEAMIIKEKNQRHNFQSYQNLIAKRRNYNFCS